MQEEEEDEEEEDEEDEEDEEWSWHVMTNFCSTPPTG